MSVSIGGDTTIESVAYEEAPHVISSSYIEDRISNTMEGLELPKGIIAILTGIRERRFFDLLPTLSSLDSQTMGETLVQHIDKFAGDATPSDDLTFLILKRK